jgi:hypothetical protein
MAELQLVRSSYILTRFHIVRLVGPFAGLYRQERTTSKIGFSPWPLQTRTACKQRLCNGPDCSCSGVVSFTLLADLTVCTIMVISAMACIQVS